MNFIQAGKLRYQRFSQKAVLLERESRSHWLMFDPTFINRDKSPRDESFEGKNSGFGEFLV